MNQERNNNGCLFIHNIDHYTTAFFKGTKRPHNVNELTSLLRELHTTLQINYNSK